MLIEWARRKKNNHFNLPTLAFTDEMKYLKGCLLLLISLFLASTAVHEE